MWYNTAINRVIKLIFPTLNTLNSYTVTYDINIVNDTLTYETPINEHNALS